MYDLTELSGTGTFLDLPMAKRLNIGKCVFALYYRQWASPKPDDGVIGGHRFAMAAMTFLDRMKAEVPGCDTKLFSFSSEPDFIDAWQRALAWVGQRTVAVGAMLMHSSSGNGRMTSVALRRQTCRTCALPPDCRSELGESYLIKVRV